MAERKEFIKRILHSEPAAVLGGLLTVHRDAHPLLTAMQAMLDGTLVNIAAASIMENGNPRIDRIVLVALGIRLFHTGGIYLNKLRKRI